MEKEKEDIFREILLKNHKKNGSCIEWTGKTNQGYGYIYIFKKTWAIHRLVYELEKGKIPENFYVLHICDNKKCFNPRHLYAGTAKDNTEDLLCSSNYEDTIEKIFQGRKAGIEYRNSHLPDPEFISIEEASRLFDVHPHTIRRAIRKGWIVAIKIGDGRRSPYRISKKTIEAIHTALIMKQVNKKD